MWSKGRTTTVSPRPIYLCVARGPHICISEYSGTSKTRNDMHACADVLHEYIYIYISVKLRLLVPDDTWPMERARARYVDRFYFLPVFNIVKKYS